MIIINTLIFTQVRFTRELRQSQLLFFTHFFFSHFFFFFSQHFCLYSLCIFFFLASFFAFIHYAIFFFPHFLLRFLPLFTMHFFFFFFTFSHFWCFLKKKSYFTQWVMGKSLNNDMNMSMGMSKGKRIYPTLPTISSKSDSNSYHEKREWNVTAFCMTGG